MGDRRRCLRRLAVAALVAAVSLPLGAARVDAALGLPVADVWAWLEPDPYTHPGDTFTTKVTVRNENKSDAGGTIDARNVSVLIGVPDGAEFVSRSPGTWTCNSAPDVNGDVRCQRSNLPAREQSFLNVTFRWPVGTAEPGTIDLEATVSADNELAAERANNRSTASLLRRPAPDASVAVAAASPSVTPGADDAAFTVTVANDHYEAAAIPVTVAATGGSLGAPAGWSCTDSSCEKSVTVAANTAQALAFTVVPTDDGAPGQVGLTATITPAANRITTNDEASAAVDVTPEADTAVSLTASQFAIVGEAASFDAEVVNNGDSSAKDVAVTLDIPTGTTFDHAVAPDGWTCGEPVSAQVTCVVALLAADEPASVELVVVPDEPGSMAGAATVVSGTSQPANATENDTSTASTEAVLVADLGVTVSGPATAAPDSEVSYVATVSNAGPHAVDSVVLGGAPDGAELVSATGDGWTCDVNELGGPLCEAETVDVGESSQLTVTYRVAGLDDGDTLLTDWAVEGDPGEFEDTAGDNFVQLETPVVAPSTDGDEPVDDENDDEPVDDQPDEGAVDQPGGESTGTGDNDDNDDNDENDENEDNDNDNDDSSSSSGSRRSSGGGGSRSGGSSDEDDDHDPRPAPRPAPSAPSTSTPPSSNTTGAPASSPSGYWMLGRDGSVYAFGDAAHHGNGATGSAVDIDRTPSGRGYWVVDATGAVSAFGDAADLGDAGPLAFGEQAVSIAAAPNGAGYWVFSSAGRVFAKGTAVHAGDLAGRPLNAPVIDATATPSGRGYYLAAADGGLFAFGDARFHGSMGGHQLGAPVVALVPDRDGTGYWLVGADGGVYAFAATFRGSMGRTPLNQPVTGMVSFGNGYLMVASDGGVFTFSDRRFDGSLGGQPPAHPIVSAAAI